MQPTPRHRASSPQSPVYVALQETVRTLTVLPQWVVGSYPAFSPLPPKRRLFSVTICLKLPPAVLSTESCSFLSGLSSPRKMEAAERPTFNYKDKKRKYTNFLYLCTALTNAWGCPFGLRTYPFHLIGIMPAKGKLVSIFVPPCSKIIFYETINFILRGFFIFLFDPFHKIAFAIRKKQY